MNRNYVVCECTGITAGQIEQAVQQGDRTFEEVKERLGVGKPSHFLVPMAGATVSG